ncbi:MAG: hypothetical protein JHC95_10545 [Solirubrobacteraceae bacterium]|nr:hypothetical protein [Solirubrobacteraceae bacterium]
MTHTHGGRRLAAAALTAAALVAPASAAAAPSVFSTTAKVIPAGQTPDATWTQANLDPQTRYSLNVNGFPVTLNETNGDLTGGVVGYDVLPPLYRNLFAKPRWLTEGATGAQPHATCDVAALTADSAVLAWQGDEPAYAYIPFQATSAGIGDDPAKWLPTVKTATGLTLTETTDLSAACTQLGGTFTAADTIVDKPAVLASGLTAPLETKVTELNTKVTDLTKAKSTADAQIAALKLEAAQFKLTIDANTLLARGLKATVTGPPNRPVFIRALVTQKQQKILKLKYQTLGTGTGATDAKGKGVVVIQPNKKTAGILQRWQVPIPVTFDALSGDRHTTLVQHLGG